MRQFIGGGDEAYSDLERRARGACVVFRRQEMPPGTQPSTATIGFEVDPAGGTAQLLVKDVQSYTGSDDSVRDWIASGSRRFPSFKELRQWIQGDLARLFQPVVARGVGSVEDLTDLNTIRKGTPNANPTPNVDRDTLLKELRAQVRGQDDAMLVLSRRVCRHLARPNPVRPLTVFEIGPTGVGKTLAATALASSLTSLDPDSGFRFLRLDMSEYQEAHRISQLLGSPQGYIGYNEGAQLVDTLAAHPRCVVLFDEIEKAHPDILRALMNAMDAGRLSSASAARHAREIDCRYAIFMFTSNLDCSATLRDLDELDAFGDPAIIDGICRKHLRAAGVAPELVGRINCFLPFKQIGPEVIGEIVALNIARAAQEYGLTVAYIEPEVVLNIIRQAPVEGFGIRPYQYFIDDILGDAFASAAIKPQMAGPIRLCAGPPIHCEPCAVSTGIRPPSWSKEPELA